MCGHNSTLHVMYPYVDYMKSKNFNNKNPKKFQKIQKIKKKIQKNPKKSKKIFKKAKMYQKKFFKKAKICQKIFSLLPLGVSARKATKAGAAGTSQKGDSSSTSPERTRSDDLVSFKPRCQTPWAPSCRDITRDKKH
jgi:hypothetical protein